MSAPRKQPQEVSKLVAILQAANLERNDLRQALVQVKGLVDRIYQLEEEVKSQSQPHSWTH